MAQQDVLDKLQTLSIQHETHSHGAVMTVEAQASCEAILIRWQQRLSLAARPHAPALSRLFQVAALAGVDGVCTKNLFLKVLGKCVSPPPPPRRRAHQQSSTCSFSRLPYHLCLPAGQARSAVHCDRGCGHQSGPEGCARAQRLPREAALQTVAGSIAAIARQASRGTLAACDMVLLSPSPHIAVLSARLGTGRGGIRMAPDELITQILQAGWAERQLQRFARRSIACTVACRGGVLQAHLLCVCL